ncbi:MAG: DUF3179 domain-containing protein [candidate division Zixibacteria bacterium]|nr:DUF3179 domain-containing protein [candidate division Zixibacteria bacterium]
MCYSGIVYAARVDTLTLTFQASGSLWRDALVMQDLQTESLWSQISGECISGALKGTTLQLLPSFHTTFAEFRKQYPNGLVLEKPERGGPRAYARYFNDPDKLGIFGRANTFEQLPAKSLVYGLRLDDGAYAVSEQALESNTAVVLNNASPPVVVLSSGDASSAHAFHLPATLDTDHLDLTLEDGVLTTPNSDHQWDAFTGAGLNDASPDLKTAPLISAYWFAWASFFPDTRLQE